MLLDNWDWDDEDPPFDEFVAAMKEDQTIWWMGHSGTHLNLFEDALTRIHELEVMNRTLVTENTAVVAELRHQSFIAEQRFATLAERRKEIEDLKASVRELNDLVQELQERLGFP